MKIKCIRIENFRCFRDETINFDDYNCLVGPNGSGKSTVLNAMNVFFRDSASSYMDLVNLKQDDFYAKETGKPIRITITFHDLSTEAKVDFKDYVRQDLLIVSATAEWDAATNTAIVKQSGSRLGMKEFSRFFKMVESAGKDDLAAIFADIRQKFPEVKVAKTKAAMSESLSEYENEHPAEHAEIESGDQFYGFTGGRNLLAKYIQWIFVPAVKDASTEQKEAKNTVLGKLLERTVRSKVKFTDKIKELRMSAEKQYQDLLNLEQTALDSLSASLSKRLVEWAHPDAGIRLIWDKADKSVRIEEPFAKSIAIEGGFEGDEIARFGHGLQRSYLLALLHELSGIDDAGAPRLLLGIEEPELFQHPPQAQHLAEVLERLSQTNAQVFVCTHSPYYVVGKGFEDIRMVCRPDSKAPAYVKQATFKKVSEEFRNITGETKWENAVEGVRAKIHQALQPALNEMFFCRFLVLVEGIEDVAYVLAGMHLAGLWEKWRHIGGHIVPVGGKSKLKQPITIGKLMGIPMFTVFDADGNESNAQRRLQHSQDNLVLLKLLGQPKHPVFPSAVSWQAAFAIWPENIGHAIKSDYDASNWAAWNSEVERRYDQVGDLDKNPLFIGDVTELAWKNKPSPILGKLCKSIVESGS